MMTSLRYLSVGDKDFSRHVQSESWFFDRMDKLPVNLLARHTKSGREYMQTYIASQREFTSEEIDHLEKCFAVVIEKLQDKQFEFMPDMQVSVGKVDGCIENGYPHTMGGMVSIPGNATRISPMTLLHELVHIFQKKNPALSRVLVEDVWKFERAPSSCEKDLNSMRLNPDIPVVYSRDGFIPLAAFGSTRRAPRNIGDAQLMTFDCSSRKLSRRALQIYNTRMEYEHPFEMMAYIVVDVVFQQKGMLKTPLHSSVYIWMLSCRQRKA